MRTKVLKNKNPGRPFGSRDHFGIQQIDNIKKINKFFLRALPGPRAFFTAFGAGHCVYHVWNYIKRDMLRSRTKRGPEDPKGAF